jgi:7-cyano-7-deazaguanine reductase
MDVTHLGRTSALPASPEEAVLDYVDNPRLGRPYLVRFTAPEFTSLCPVTGQPISHTSSSITRRRPRS